VLFLLNIKVKICSPNTVAEISHPHTSGRERGNQEGQLQMVRRERERDIEREMKH
jgi:hypothetical protein